MQINLRSTSSNKTYDKSIPGVHITLCTVLINRCCSSTIFNVYPLLKFGIFYHYLQKETNFAIEMSGPNKITRSHLRSRPSGASQIGWVIFSQCCSERIHV